MTNGTDIDEREENLPRWAQQKLTTLRLRLREAQEAAHVDGHLGGSNKKSNVWLKGLGQPGLAPFLPSRWDTARCYINDDRDSWVAIRKSKDGPFVEIHANSALMVMPTSSNWLHVAPIEDYVHELPRYIGLGVESLRRRLARDVPRADR